MESTEVLMIGQSTEMEEQEIRSCYACIQQNLDLIPIIDQIQVSSKTNNDVEEEAQQTLSFHIGNVIAKHFWFQLDDLIDGYICTRCWTKIKDFHEFYSEIEEAHGQSTSFTLVEIKEESDPVEELDVEHLVEEKSQEQETLERQSEHEVDDEEEEEEETEIANKKSENEADPEEEEAYDPQEDAPPRHRRKRIKKKGMKIAERMAETDQLIARYCNIHCDQCSQEFPTMSTLQTHSLAEHQRKAYVFCCERKFNNRIRLLDHVQLHEDPNRFQCKVCDRACLDREGLKKHTRQMHTPEEKKPHRCDQCAKSFIVENDFLRHLQYHEAMATKRYQCQEEGCDKFFGNSSLLKQHVKNSHAVTFEFVCDTCAKGFNGRSLFLKHLQEHEGKPVPVVKAQCPICGQWLLKSALSKHVVRHNATAVRCDKCDKECPNLLALRSHKQFVHKEAKFECTVCGKMFKRSITLREHMTTHSGAVLYTCLHCPKTFNSNANMHSHRKKMHPQEWLETRMQRLAKYEKE